MALLTGLTIEEFEQLPDALARNHELVNGELVDVSGNVFNHNGLRDVLVEVLRPSTDKFDALIEKPRYYRSRGVKEVYLFSIQNRQVFRYSDGPTIVLSDSEEFRPEQIPGFSIRISDLLAMI